MGSDAAAERERYLCRVLDALEAGRIQPYEYTRCVLALNATSSPERMAAVVHEALDGPADGAAGHPLDPVDLALLTASRTRPTRRPSARYISLALVFVMFAVLIVVGVWLAAHAHALSSPTGVVVRVAGAPGSGG